MNIAYDPSMQWYLVESEGGAHVKKTEKKQSLNTHYQVYYSTSQQMWICNCNSFRYKNMRSMTIFNEKKEEAIKNGKEPPRRRTDIIECKHIKAVKEYKKPIIDVIN